MQRRGKASGGARQRGGTFVAVGAVAVLLLAGWPGLGHAPAPDGLHAGAASVDITPPLTTPLWGYTARHGGLALADDLLNGHAGMLPRFLDQRVRGVDTEAYAKTFLMSEGVHTRLHANAFVLEDARTGTTVALVHVDLGGFPGELHQAVADRLAERGMPIPREHLMVSATHTHGGPGGFFLAHGYALLGGDAFDPRIFTFLADRIADAVAEAWAAREPATLATGTALLTGASHNRSTGAHRLGHGEDHDHVKAEARILRIDTQEGRPLGAVTMFANHGIIVGHRDLVFTGDNQGVAWRMLAEGIAAASGQPAGEVVVAYLNGAQGDVSPDGHGDGLAERAEDAGRRQAGPLLAAWQSLEGKGTSDVPLDARFRLLCMCGQEVQDGEAISPVPILGQGDGQTMPPPLQVPGHGGKVPLLVAPGFVPQFVRLQVMALGDHVLLAMPGEASMALGEAIEQDALSLGAARADVVGVANDYLSYMSTVPEYDAQDYEGSFNLYGRMTGPLFRQELAMMASALLRDEPVEPVSLGLPEPPQPPIPPVAPLTLLPGRAPGIVAQPAMEVARGEVVAFAWAGGSPAVDHPPDEAMVRIVRLADGAVVEDDLGWRMPVMYRKQGHDLHRWSAEWRLPLDAQPGDYRFEVQGRAVTAPGQVDRYHLPSKPFTVLT